MEKKIIALHLAGATCNVAAIAIGPSMPALDAVNAVMCVGNLLFAARWARKWLKG